MSRPISAKRDGPGVRHGRATARSGTRPSRPWGVCCVYAFKMYVLDWGGGTARTERGTDRYRRTRWMTLAEFMERCVVC